MESVARNPYSSTRPVFDLIPGGQTKSYDKASEDVIERLQVIESQNAEILRMLGMAIQDESGQETSSSVKLLWRMFLSCQIVGFATLIVAELGRLAFEPTKNLRFLGLGLIFVAIESVLVAKFLQNRGGSHGSEATADTDL